MSVQLKDRNMQVPGGLSYVFPATGWDSRTVLYPMPSLEVIADAYIQHILGNPHLIKKYNLSTNRDAVITLIANYNAEICFSMGWKDFITSDAPIPPPPPPSPPQGRGAVFAASLKRTSSGIKLVADWLGEGLTPVDRDVAEKRAAICATCPLNQEGDFWQRLNAVAAHKLKTLMAIKNDMDLKTPHDDQLKSCVACDCWNPLKVWAPLSLILKNSTPDVTSKLHESCWVLAESK